MEQYLTPNLVKSLEILKLLAEHDQGVSSPAIEKQLSIPRTTAFRILKTLCYMGMAQKRGNSFYAGAVLFEVGLQALSKFNLRERAVPALQELTAKTGQTSHLAVPSGWHSLILEVCDSPSPIRVASRSGTLADLHCSATGKIFLAYLFKERIEEYCSIIHPTKRTDKTVIDADSLVTIAEQVGRDGYATDDEEYHAGVRCVGAGVFDMQNNLIAAVGITGQVSAITDENLVRYRDAVVESAKKLSMAIGKR